MNNIAKSVINLACDVIGKTIDKNNENVLKNPDIHKSIIDLNVPEPSNYYKENELY